MKENATVRVLREAEPIRDVTCLRCGGQDAVIFPVPDSPRGCCACPVCSGPALMADLEAMTVVHRAEMNAA